MISAVILTHNSARSLATTLDHLTWCDQIVVVDDDSTDDTVAVARKCTEIILNHPMKGDFAAQRNFGLSKATGEWVFFVDADEVVTRELREEIESVLSDTTHDGFYIRRTDTVWNHTLRYGETSQVRLLRLARKGSGIWQRPVHEVWDVHGFTKTLKHPLLHFPHPDVTQFLDDINIYSTANAKYLFERGVRVRWWHIVGYPLGKFVLNYIGRKGFLDGTPGALLAFMMSFHSFLTRAKLWLLWKQRG